MRTRLSTGSNRRDAVSEVIANLLVLSITVILFASIFYFVNTMPGPEGRSFQEFSGTLETNDGYACTGTVWVNITLQGGTPLNINDFLIFLTTDGSPGSGPFDLVDGGIFDRVWAVGESWSMSSSNSVLGALGNCVTQSTVVNANVVDVARSAIIWDADIFPKTSLFGPQVFGGTDPQPVAAGVLFTLWARVVDIEGVGIGSVSVTSTDLGIAGVPMVYNFARDRWEFYPAGPLDAGKYSFTVTASNSLNRTTVKTIYFFVGGVSIGVDLDVDREFITMSPATPVRGTVTSVSAVIYNLGNANTAANVTFYLDAVSPARIIGRYNITSIPAAGGEEARITWKAEPAGLHTIWVRADTFPSPSSDVFPGNNLDSESIIVLPKILLVDDDQQPDGAGQDSASFVKAALYATDFSYDLYVNGAGTGPDYDTGSTKLKDYDVVIWSTGKSTTSTLTANDPGAEEDDVGHLKLFLGAAGKLWLISEGVMDEAVGGAGNARLAGFLGTQMNVNTAATMLSAGAPASFQTTGTALWKNRVLNFTSAARWAPDGTDRVASFGGAGDEVMRDAAAPTNIYAVNSSTTTLFGDSRTVLMAHELSFAADYGDQAQVVYHVLLWLTGIDKKLGRDIAVASFSINPKSPRFMQDVTINVTVRNNGDQDEADFQVLFVDVFNGMETIIGAPSTVTFLAAFGDSTVVTKVWRPDKVGLHELRARADWNNKIPETNEQNNEISALLFDGDVFVGYNILLVDDDGGDGAVIGTPGYNTTQSIIDDFFEQGQGASRPVFEYDLSYVQPDKSGPDAATMRRYNAVVWNTGTTIPALGLRVLLTPDDRTNITQFLEAGIGGSMFVLIAPNIKNELDLLAAGALKTAYESFLSTNFGFDVNTVENVSSPLVYGKLNDEVAHGLRILTDPSLGSGVGRFGMKRASVVAGPTNYGILHGDPVDDYWTINTSKYYAIRARNTVFNHRTAWFGMSPTYFTNASTDQVPRSELTYMLLHWLGVPDERGNAKVTPPDIFVTTLGNELADEHLEVSRSYVLKVQVRNTGQKTLNGLAMRYLDDGDIIATESASISASSVASDWTVTNGRSIVEAIWTPLFAGLERIEVQVDPDNVASERTKVDNEAMQSTQIFFFYDDLESGDGKWRHEGVIARINGENALDILPLGVNAQTDIAGAWGTGNYTTVPPSPHVSGLASSNLESHSDPNSFWFPESPAKPVDAVVAIDTSGSMNGTDVPAVTAADAIVPSCPVGSQYRLCWAKIGAFRFLDIMRDKDRVGLAFFSGEAPCIDPTNPSVTFTPASLSDACWKSPMIQTTVANKAILKSTVDAIVWDSSTPYYDMQWTAAHVVYNLNSWIANRTLAILTLSDGSSNSDEDEPVFGAHSTGTGTGCGDTGTDDWEIPWAGATATSGLRNLPVRLYSIGISIGAVDQCIQQDIVSNAVQPSQFFAVTGASVGQLGQVFQGIANELIGGVQNRAPGADKPYSSGGDGRSAAPPPPSPSATVNLFSATFETTVGNDSWTAAADLNSDWARGCDTATTLDWGNAQAGDCAWATDPSLNVGDGNDDYAGSQVGTRFTSPTLWIPPSAALVTVSFYEKHQFDTAETDNNDRVDFRTSFNGGGYVNQLRFSETAEPNDFGNTGNVWTLRSFDATSFRGGTITMQFIMTSDGNANADNGFYLDTVSVDMLTCNSLTVAVAPASATVSIGGAQAFAATATCSTGGSPATIDVTATTTIGWGVTSQGTVAPASGSSTTFTATTLGLGTVYANASRQGVTGSGSASVTVNCGSLVVTVTPSSAVVVIGGNQTFAADVKCATTTITGLATITWTVTGGVGTVAPGVGTSTVLTGTNSGSGSITATAVWSGDSGAGSAAVVVVQQSCHYGGDFESSAEFAANWALTNGQGTVSRSNANPPGGHAGSAYYLSFRGDSSDLFPNAPTLDPDNSLAVLTVNTSGGHDLRLSFWYRFSLNTEGRSSDSRDLLIIDVDDGTGYVNDVADYTYSEAGGQNVWASAVLPLFSFDPNPNFKIRFRGSLDSALLNEYVYVDDVQVCSWISGGSGGGGCAYTTGYEDAAAFAQFWTLQNGGGTTQRSTVAPRTDFWSLRFVGDSSVADDTVFDATNNIAQLTLDLSISTHQNLTFWWMGNGGVDNRASGLTDFLIVDVNPGTGWVDSIWNGALDDLGAENTWVRQTVDLSPYANSTVFKIRLRGSITGTGENYYVDDLRVCPRVNPGGGGGGGSGGGCPPTDGPACLATLVPRKWAVTPELDLRGVTKAKLTLWHRYKVLQGHNGGLVQIGVPANNLVKDSFCPSWHVGPCEDDPTKSFTVTGSPVTKSVLREADGWHWEYVSPIQPYPGNMNLSRVQLDRSSVAAANADTEYLMDEDGDEMVFAWNGVSSNGKFDWEYAEFDLTPWAGLENVRLNASYFQFTGGTGFGWWIDDFTITVTRSSAGASPEARDRWLFRNDPTQAGNDAFWNDMTGWPWNAGSINAGLDNSVQSVPIALTSARLAYLSFDTRFNINNASGIPPDGVRIEVSDDNGNTWSPVNLGIRMDSGISGGGAAPAWVNSGSLQRVESNLSGWAGSVILLRFRAISTTDNRPHCDDCSLAAAAENYGVWVDNVRISGESVDRRTADAEIVDTSRSRNARETVSAPGAAEPGTTAAASRSPRGIPGPTTVGSPQAHATPPDPEGSAGRISESTGPGGSDTGSTLFGPPDPRSVDLESVAPDLSALFFAALGVLAIATRPRADRSQRRYGCALEE